MSSSNLIIYKKISEIANLKRGVAITKDFINRNKGSYPVYSSQTSLDGNIGSINHFSFNGEYLTWTTHGSNAGTIFYRNGKFNISSHCGLIDVDNNIAITKYIYYLLKNHSKKIFSLGSAIPMVSSNVIGKILVPIPSIQKQKEIVNILDKFDELTRELTNRKKQYKYYMNHLINCETNNIKKISEIANIKTGERITKKSLVKEGEYPVISGGKNPMGNYTNYNFKDNTITIAKYGTAGFVDFQYNNFWANDVCYVVTPNNEKIDNKFLYYLLKVNQSFIYKLAVDAIPKHLPETQLKNLEVNVPPLEKQKEIVKILDKFESLISNLNEGLPKEIELVQKQYEYYRAKLLNFERE